MEKLLKEINIMLENLCLKGVRVRKENRLYYINGLSEFRFKPMHLDEVHDILCYRCQLNEHKIDMARYLEILIPECLDY